MPVITNFIHIKTNGENDMVNITKETSKAVVESNMVNGVAVVFVTGSTAAITTIEFEPGLKKDFPNMLARIAPKEIEYQHDNTWQDGNGHSHVRASIIGPSITIPFVDGKIMLGMWQQIVILEMDIQPREREIIIQIIGA